MTAAATPGGAGGPPAESALTCDLRALRSIHRHLCILADDYADVTAGTYLGDAANSTALAIDRLAIFGRSLQAPQPANSQKERKI